MQPDLPLPIHTPCGADFAAMTPVQRRERLCVACDRVVHDLTGRSDEEVRSLLADGPACIRYLYDASGRRLDALPPGATLVPARALLSRSARRRWLQTAALATSVIVLEACGGNDGGRMFSDPTTMPGVYPSLPDGPDGSNGQDAGAEDAADAGPPS